MHLPLLDTIKSSLDYNLPHIYKLSLVLSFRGFAWFKNLCALNFNLICRARKRGRLRFHGYLIMNPFETWGVGFTSCFFGPAVLRYKLAICENMYIYNEQCVLYFLLVCGIMMFELVLQPVNKNWSQI